MSLYSQFETDPELEKTGIWLEYDVNSKGEPIKIRIARAGGANTQFTKRMEQRVKPLRRQIQNETLSVDAIQKLTQEVYSEAVVLEWLNVEDRDGNPIPFSAANVAKLFQDIPDLFLDIQEQAQRSALFRKHIQQADSGN